MNFYALDIKTQKALGERIGLDFDAMHNKDRVKVVIVAPHQEIIYEMKSNLEQLNPPLSLGQSISAFVDTFHTSPSQLVPMRLSKKLKPEYNHRTKSHISDISEKCDKPGENSCIQEINGERFNRFVMKESGSKNVVLLYKTSACAFCTAGSSAAHVFHTVSRLFR